MPGTDRPDPFEDRLSAALREAGDDFPADRAALVTAGRVRGRRALLRRRTAVVGGVAGVALAGVGGVFVLPADDPGTGRSTAASAGTASGTATAAASAFTGDDLLRELKGLLPGDVRRGVGPRHG
ncbi:LigA protein OS=Streptomyces tendae OX=1932 GN=GUR47_15765 PE=4 SV=1 [Streptomyces tendae]